MEKMTLQELLTATEGTLAGEFLPAPEQVFFTGISTDNRKVSAGDVFVAVVGERLDGHSFVQAALEAGAEGCIISEEPEEYLPGKWYVLVEDTLRALGSLAAYYRRKFEIPVIAVTGSVGKTTTKQMLASVLSQRLHVLFTEGNLNNHIGLPLTVLRLDHSHEAAVLEMGMNHFAEIDYLTRIAAPDVAVITNVGDAHIQNLGSRENIFRAKCEIFHGLKSGGTAILNGDDTLLRTLDSAVRTPETAVKDEDGEEDSLYIEIQDGNYHFIRVGESEDCTLRAEEIEESSDSIRFTVREGQNRPVEITVPAPGRHMIYPALTAAAAGRLYGLTWEEIAAGVLSFTQTGMRMKITKTPKGVVLMNDTYNANPQSMQAALQILAGSKDAASKVAVLGDMLELGDFSENLHRQIGRFAAESGIGTLITVGPEASFIAEEARACGLTDVHVCPGKEEAKQELKQYLRPGTAILFKASRGMALEELVEFSSALCE